MIDGRLDFFDFVANDVPSHWEGLSIDEFAVRLISVGDQRTTGVCLVAANQRGHDHLNPGGCEHGWARVVNLQAGR